MTGQNYTRQLEKPCPIDQTAEKRPHSAPDTDKRQKADSAPPAKSLLIADENEEWRPVVGREDRYEVSCLGRIRSIPRMQNGRHLKGVLLKTQIINTGYERVPLSDNGKQRPMLIHRVVAMAFIPNPNNLPEVNHIDGNPLNNRLSNLEWVDSTQNTRHAIKIGSKVGVSPKISHSVIDRIIADHHSAPANSKPTQQALSQRYGISRASVQRLLSNHRKSLTPKV